MSEIEFLVHTAAIKSEPYGFHFQASELQTE